MTLSNNIFILNKPGQLNNRSYDAGFRIWENFPDSSEKGRKKSRIYYIIIRYINLPFKRARNRSGDRKIADCSFRGYFSHITRAEAHLIRYLSIWAPTSLRVGEKIRPRSVFSEINNGPRFESSRVQYVIPYKKVLWMNLHNWCAWREVIAPDGWAAAFVRHASLSKDV